MSIPASAARPAWASTTSGVPFLASSPTDNRATRGASTPSTDRETAFAAFQAEQAPEPPEPGLRVVQGGKTRRTKSKPKAPKAQKRGSMMERFEERWRRRKEQNGGL